MTAIRNVLVATDFSDSAAAALQYGRELARTCQARLHVMHVVDDIRWRSLDMTPALTASVQESLVAEAESQLQALVTSEDRTRLHAVEVVQTAAAPAEALIEYAVATAIDIIVVGTRGRSGIPRVLLGSVAERVVRLAPCPV
ncbi:MAG: universal stress protein, partial [Vicinamibacterales bacterium]